MKTLLSAIALATAFAGSAGAADIVSSGDLRSVDKWYGRAGGLAGSDRVGALSTGDAKVGVIFDQDVAARIGVGVGIARIEAALLRIMVAHLDVVEIGRTRISKRKHTVE